MIAYSMGFDPQFQVLDAPESLVTKIPPFNLAILHHYLQEKEEVITLYCELTVNPPFGRQFPLSG
jgi:hypothetical protein